MKIEDINQVMEIERECFTEPWSESVYKHIITSSKYSKYFTLKKDDFLVGYIGICLLGNEAEIHTLAVRKSCQKQGYAHMLLNYVLEFCLLYNIESIYLEVRKTNFPALHLYKKFNFKIIKTIKDYYKNPNEDAYLMKFERRNISDKNISN